MFGALTGWGVTDQPEAERLLHTTDGGMRWSDVTPVSAGRRIAVGDVAFLDALTAWASSYDRSTGDAVQTFSTGNGGKTWRRLNVPAPGWLHFISARNGWAMSGVGPSEARKWTSIVQPTADRRG